MATGTIIRLDLATVLGCIAPDDKTEDVYFNPAIVSTKFFERLARGQKVSYDPVDGLSGYTAINIVINE
jgi:cold shock CspA family protein